MAQGLLDCPVKPGNDSMHEGSANTLLDSGFALARALE
jgi:hypothetical protein